MAAEALLDGEAEALTRSAIQEAKKGNMLALRLCMERIMPPRRARRIELPLPPIEKSADVLSSFAEIVRAMSLGQITPDEAESMGSLSGFLAVLAIIY
jgi:hypothetical protein